MKVKSESEVAQSCLTLSDYMDRSLPGSSVHGIFQARVLEWGAIAFSEWVFRLFLIICYLNNTGINIYDIYNYTYLWLCLQEHRAESLAGYKLHLTISHRRRQYHPTPVFLPGKSHGRRSLVGCSSWGHEELDTTERLHFHFSLSCFGEGNGNPLQRSCLENPRDGGAWWAATYGVAQSQTRLKRLSSSNHLPTYLPKEESSVLTMFRGLRLLLN